MNELEKLFNNSMAWPGTDSILITREQLSTFGAKAFDHGSKCMADQISEDHFGGEKTFNPQYNNPYL